MKASVLDRIRGGDSIGAVFRETGITKATIIKWMTQSGVQSAFKQPEKQKPAEFTHPELPTEGRTAEEILESRKNVWKRKKDYYEARKLIDVQVNIEGPIAIAHFGDMHIDDDGVNIDLVRHHMDLVKNTEGMFAGNIGDVTNNWVGNLARLYAEQATTASEGWTLAEWLIGYLPWLYIIAGNHDVWSGHRDPLKWLTQKFSQPYVNHGTRLRLNFPNGRNMIGNIAHNFKGYSQFNPVHAPMKKAMRWHDDFFVCGHLHHTGLGIVVDPQTQRICWCIRVDSYKEYEEYPKQSGIDETYASPCVTTILNPDHESERDKVLVCLDPDQAAEILTDMRARWKAKQKRAKKKTA